MSTRPLRPLTEVVQQARQAIDGGNYRLAAETCRRVLGQFPEFATAHRLLGEALLEQGDAEGAERAFQATLERDPQSPAAYLGLGLIAEERGNREAALAYVQVAWEIAPHRADLRHQVVRLSEQVFGPGGRLHLTRPALASLHYAAGRWSRTVAECVAVLEAHPSRIDVRLRLAEALWRRGDDPRAAEACRAVLEAAPNAVVALLILADIERRAGDRQAAESLLARARAIDPDGVRAADLIVVGADELAEFWLPSELPLFDEAVERQADTAPPRVAPAPDFISEAPASKAPAPETPAAAGEAADRAGAGDRDPFESGLPTQEEIDAARPPAQPTAGYTDMLDLLDAEGVAPFEFEERAGAAGDAARAGRSEAAGEIEDVDDAFGLASDEDIDAARPAAEAPRGYTGLLESLGDSGVRPFDPGAARPSGAEPEPAFDLPSWLDEDRQEAAEPEPARAAAGESEELDIEAPVDWSAIDEQLREAIPGDTPAGYTRHLDDLEAAGFEPFAFEPAAEAEPRDQEPETPAPEDGERAVPEPSDPSDRASRSTPPAASVERAAFFGDWDAAPEPAGAAPGEAWEERTGEPAPAAAEAAAGSSGWAGATAFSQLRAVVTRLGVNGELFARARAARAALIASGAITGARRLGPDIEALEARVAERPDDPAPRWELAAALLDEGQAERALEQLRWLYRHAGASSEQAAEPLGRLAEAGGATGAAADRLLGAIYRRERDFRLSARHYERSLAAYRRGEGA